MDMVGGCSDGIWIRFLCLLESENEVGIIGSYCIKERRWMKLHGNVSRCKGCGGCGQPRLWLQGTRKGDY